MTQCTWCNDEAVYNLEIRPAKYKTNAYGMKAIIKNPVLAPVCRIHQRIVEQQPTFYTCGCTYVEGENKCSFHGRKLRSVKTKLTAIQE